MVNVRLLNRMKLTVLSKPFHCRDLATLGQRRQLQARAYRLTVHQHGACSTDADSATLTNAHELQAIAQNVQERMARKDIDLNL